MKNQVEIACFYDEKDAELHDQFMHHLGYFLKNNPAITYWDTHQSTVGLDKQQVLENHLRSADIILLLISAEFTDSDDYDLIVKQALKRMLEEEIRVIVIYLRDVLIDDRLAQIERLPDNGKAIIPWHNPDTAFTKITNRIKEITEEVRGISEAPHLPWMLRRLTSLPSPTIRKKLIRRLSSRKNIFLQSITYISLLLVIIVVSSLFVAYRGLFTNQPSSPTPTSSAQGCGNIHAPLLCTYNGHQGQEVYGVSWSPKGTSIASGGYDKKVQVWDPITGNTIVSYSGHTGAISAVAWSPNGDHLASASYDGTVQVWDVTGSPLRTYRGHISSDEVLAVAWSPNGKLIASGSQDGTVQVWDASTGQTITTYNGHISSDSTRNWVNTLAWSPDGTRIASGSNDKTVQVWDAQTGQTIQTYKEHPDTVYAVAWSPNGKFIASSGGGKVQVWNPDTGESSLTYAAKAWSIAWSPSSKFIVIGTDNGTVQELDSIHGTPIFAYPGSPGRVYTVAWSSDGTRIASGGTDGMVRVWQVAQF